MPEEIFDEYRFAVDGYKYQYELLFNGKTWRCRPGVDFIVGRESFLAQIRKIARRRGLDIRTAREKDGCVVIRTSAKKGTER